MAPNGGAARTLSTKSRHPPARSGDFCFTPNVERQSILWSRRTPTSQTTFDTFDRQLERNQWELERRASAYRVQTDKHYNNSRPHEDAVGLWDHGNIVDKGKGKGTVRALQGTYNPLTNTWVVPPRRSERWDETPACSDETYRRQKSHAHMCTLGEYNPIVHRWEVLPDEEEQRARDRDVHIRHGFMGGSGHKKRVACPQGTYDPIKCKWIERPPNNPWLERSNGTWPPAGRRSITGGETWGQYDPVLNYWLEPPTHPKYRDPEGVAPGALTRERRRVPTPDSYGVYDPSKTCGSIRQGAAGCMQA